MWQDLLLERLDKASICRDPSDVGAIVNLVKFLWTVKFHAEQVIDGIRALKTSHGKRTSSNQYLDLPPLVCLIEGWHFILSQYPIPIPSLTSNYPKPYCCLLWHPTPVPSHIP
ncbi:unnamed protein product [Absidia cylindrospora]